MRRFDIGDVVMVHDATTAQKRNIPIETDSIGIVVSGADLDRKWNQKGEPSVDVFFGEKGSTSMYGYEVNYFVRVEDLTYIGGF